ncbi:MAG: hypothetical protein LBP41_00740 [Holosporaceae bacterium]|jgi:hypothetical protein|nr:hypothetical protein [Holosporaceae bacterium]
MKNKKIYEKHLKFCEKSIILPEARSALISNIYILFTFLVYKGYPAHKKLTLISPVTGNTGNSLIFEGLRTGNMPVPTGNGVQALCNRGYRPKESHYPKITSPKLKNTNGAALQPHAYIPP